MTGQSVQTAELMELSFVEQTKTDQHVVERGCVVALRGEEDVRLLGALPEIAYLIQEHPAHDLERAEARADVARPRAGDHVERVDASQRGKRPRPCDVGDVRVEQAAELVNGHELKLERFALVGLYITHQRRAGPCGPAGPLCSHYCERFDRQPRQGHFSLGEQPLGHYPVEGVVDVEPFVAFSEERYQYIAGYRPTLADDARPGDLEGRVLHKNLRQRLIGRAVPRLFTVSKWKEREHAFPAHDPHLARMLRAQLDGAE